ncbi:endonuclease/exonuclease/phosphatase [Klebsiella pneumoniae]|uniref:Endonuclease/exonuclease/phosphatase n=1 Tax=Klebsiella pneumoniae TaxID=573 RepID=A0A377UZY3_KLEPN|nr:endonuclease/exonuclease/phosphatase [Klebsiella pneumoniae]
MTLASAHPIYCCPLREREPILRLPKSALVTVYPLPDARLLMVVNIHAVNFSLGVDVYSKQLLPIGDPDRPSQRAGDHGRRLQCLEPAADECAVPLCA